MEPSLDVWAKLGELFEDEEDTGLHATPPSVVSPLDEPTRQGAARLRFVCIAGADCGRTFPLRNSAMLIGRGPVDISLTGSDVSRQHARVRRASDGYWLEDLKSRNGVWINGARVEAPTLLRMGDRVQLGTTILLFEFQDALADRLVQQQRIDAMAAAISGLAHDFNNALQVIVSGIEQLTLEPPESIDSQAAVADMKLASATAVRLAKHIMSLGQLDGSVEPIDLHDVVHDALRMTKRLTDKRIVIDTHVPRGLVVQGVGPDLQNVVVNVVRNACDAMAGGGRLEIRSELVDIDLATAFARGLPVSAQFEPGKYVALAIRDTGCGMDELTLARAFDPYFTTKSPGKGTGLGLTMVHAAIRRHGGMIDVQSAVGSGTTFRMFLPARA